jgi:hypothetical protein
MRETEGVIERLWRLSAQIQRLEISVEPALAQLQPGQSLLAAGEGSQWDPYLREHWIPVEGQNGLLTIDRPLDQRYKPGQVVSLMGPVGLPLPWTGGGGKHLLLLAQDTWPTPLLMLAQRTIAQTAEAALVLMGTARDYPFAGIPPAVEVINAGDDGKWADQNATLQWADQIFAVLHPSFWRDQLYNQVHELKKARSKLAPDFFYVLANLPFPCGTGACMACMVRGKMSNKLACTQGPALDVTEVML